MTLVYDVQTDTFARNVIQRSLQVPVIVDFWAEWCGPCKVLGPILEKVVAESGGAVELAKLDVDANQQLAAQFGIQGIPTVIAFKDGQPVAQFTGALPEAQVREWVRQLLPSEADKQVVEAERLIDAGQEEAAAEILAGVLSQQPDHEGAGVALAGLYLDRGDVDAAMTVLDRLVPSDAVQQLKAAARLTAAENIDLDAVRATLEAEPSNLAARVKLAEAEAAHGDYEAALNDLLAVVAAKDEEQSEEARKAMVDIFELLGNDDPLVKAYRAKLASALF